MCAKHRPEPDARSLATEILHRVDRAGAYASLLLESHAQRLRDSRDVALLHEWVYGVLRNRSALDHGLGRAANRPIDQIDEDLRPLLRVAAYSLWMLDRVPEHAAVDQAVARTPYKAGRDRKGFVNAVLRRAATAGRELLPPEPASGDLEGLALHRSHPLWWIERAVERWGWVHTAELTAANNQPPPSVLHVDPRKSDVPGMLDLCRQRELSASPGRYFPGAIRIEGGGAFRGFLRENPACWAQDEASQLIPVLLGDPGDRVADFCAAPGGKTLQIACAQRSGQKTWAFDRNAGRVERLRKRVAGAELTGVEVVQLDSGDPSALEGYEPFDRLLVDAPCSGTGTLRRHPEIRWRLEPQDLPRLAETQCRILSAAADKVAENGALVYSVCSVEAEEGPGVVQSFLSSRPRFRLDSLEPYLPPSAHGLIRDGAFQSSPLDDGIDGFYAVRLVRRDGV